MLHWLLLCFTLAGLKARTIDFAGEGGLAEDMSDRAAWTNGILLNQTLALLQPGDTLLIPNQAQHNSHNNIIQLDI